VLELTLLAGPGSTTVRSFATCLASVMELPAALVPHPGDEFPEAVGQWRQWLAGRGFGLAELAKPQTFNWPGYWIAVVAPDDAGGGRVAVLMFGTPGGVVLSPAAPGLLGSALSDLDVVAGFAVASLDPAGRAVTYGAGAARGVVEVVAIARAATAPMRLVPSALALAGRGLEGDRYAAKAGTFSSDAPTARGHDLTLVEAEVLDELVLPDGTRLSYPDARRNIVTRGVDLDALVGRRFLIGDVECLGQRRCEPCAHLERLTRPGTLKGLIHRGGLRADILTGGPIAAGMPIQAQT
jgi:MOSC domain-containing protein YiiM